MSIYSLDDYHPHIDPAAFVADNAVVVGRVIMSRGSSVWWNATIRGDTEWIQIGSRTNVQDGAVVHADPGFPTRLGRGVTVGHQAAIHGCTVDDGSLIGIGASVLNGAQVGRSCLIGAHALVPEGFVVPSGSLVVGVPGRIKRTLTEDEKTRLRWTADHYVRNALRYRTGLRKLQ